MHRIKETVKVKANATGLVGRTKWYAQLNPDNSVTLELNLPGNQVLDAENVSQVALLQRKAGWQSSSEVRKGTLNEWELSPNRKQVVAVASQVEDRCAEVCAISVLGLTAAGIVSIFFPPAIVLVPPLAKTAVGSFAIGAGSSLVSKTSRQVKYATITCEASVPTNKVDATCTVPVGFVGRMQTKHLENLYSQWKNQTTPAHVGDTNEARTALACLPPTQGDFLGTTTVAWERA